MVELPEAEKALPVVPNMELPEASFECAQFEGTHRARCEGTVVPPWRRVKTFVDLLSNNYLTPALEACQHAAEERLEELEDQYRDSDQLNFILQELFSVAGVLQSPDGDFKVFCQYASYCPAALAVAVGFGIDTSSAKTEFRNEILDGLVMNRAWAGWAASYNLSTGATEKIGSNG